MALPFNQIFQVIFWILPIFFMAFYHVKTRLLDLLAYPTIVIFASLPIINLVVPFPFHPDVVLVYSFSIVLGLLTLTSKYKYFTQAFSIVFIIAFLNSLYWEIPTIIYTIFVRGYIDQAMSLHLLSALPMPFLIQKVKFGKNAIYLFLLGLGVSTLFLIPNILMGIDIWDVFRNPFAEYLKVSWSINRMSTFLILLYMVYKGSER